MAVEAAHVAVVASSDLGAATTTTVQQWLLFVDDLL
jgi:hypothetical protein